MRRKLLTLSIIIILLMTLIPLPGTAGTAPAEQADKAPAATITEQPAVKNQNSAIPEQQTSNRFSRQSPYAGTEKGLRHWVYESGLRNVSTPTIDLDGIAYFTAGKDLIAVDRTGKKLWTWHSEVTLTNSPELGSDGKILITSEAGDLFALDSSGSKSWEFRHIPSENAAVNSCSDCSAGPDGTVYYVVSYNTSGTSTITLYAINPYGTLKWTAETSASGVQIGNPVISNDGTIFIKYIQAVKSSHPRSWGWFYYSELRTENYLNLRAYKNDGKLIWQNRIPSNYLPNITPVCPDNRDGVLVGVENTLYLFNQTGQKKLFESSERFMDKSGITLTNDGKIVFTSGSVAYLCDSEGVLQWKFNADSYIGSIPLTDKNGGIYFSSSNGNLYCLDPQGKEKWKSTLTGKVYGSSPVIRNDGAIYQMTNGGDLNTVGKTEIKSVSLNTHKVTLLSKGMRGILKPSCSPEDTIDNEMEWNSGNPLVATVKDGVITPVSAGKTLIKVYSQTDNISDTCEVTVVTSPGTNMTLTCDTVLERTLSFYQGVFTFQNLTLDDGVTLTNEGTSEIELVVKGVLNIGKNASIRVRNGSYRSVPTLPVSSLSAETLKNAVLLKDDNVLSISGIYGSGGNGGAGGEGLYDYSIRGYYSGGGGGGGGYGGGTGGNGGTGKVHRTGLITPPVINNKCFGKPGESDGKNGGSALVCGILNDFSLPGGEGGGALKTGNAGITGNYTRDGGSGGGGNGGNGGEGTFGSMLAEDDADGPLGGGGGGGGGYGGGVLVIAAGSINVKPGNIPCFIVSGQIGGKGGYPDGQDGDNGEGGLLVIETNSYKPSLSHWNIGTDSIECRNPCINGGHGTVTGNPKKVFINGIDMGGYDDKSVKGFNVRDRSAALILDLNK